MTKAATDRSVGVSDAHASVRSMACPRLSTAATASDGDGAPPGQRSSCVRVTDSAAFMASRCVIVSSWIRTAAALEFLDPLCSLAVKIVGSVAWARKDSTSAADPSTTSVAASPDGSTTVPAAGSGGQISIKDFAFTPASLSIEVGDSVTWTNGDGAAHSIKSGGQTFDSPDKIDQAKSFSFTFTTAGTFTYICGIHQYMKGTVVVAG